MVSCSKSSVDSPVFNINAKAKIKLLIAGFGLLHRNNIFNFTKMHYDTQKFTRPVLRCNNQKKFKMTAEIIISADNR